MSTLHKLAKLVLTDSRDNEAVIRGSKAVNMIYQLTNRVPVLIEQSHLERNEGFLSVSHCT